MYDAAGNVVASTADGKLNYPFCRKFIDPNFSGDKTSTRPYLLRYSDVALTYAEAAGPTVKAYELVNFIRNRAGLGDLEPGLDKETFRERVMDEAPFRTGFRGKPRYDPAPLEPAHTDIAEAKGQGLSAEQMVFYPIPSVESDLNPNL